MKVSETRPEPSRTRPWSRSGDVRCGTGWPAINGARLAVDLPRWPLLLVAVCLLRRRGAVHNLIAHPLLTLCPPVGEWLHGRTAP